MEMNTRLQVEHPVTEEITGVDLVEWQLRVASGEPLPKRQDELSINGWAMEARLYAEDPAKGFLPSVGRLYNFILPDGPRIETGVEDDDEVSPYYDPMIAKIIVREADRLAAVRRLAGACGEVQCQPVRTNAWFLKRLLNREDVRRGDVHTGLISDNANALTAAPTPSDLTLQLAAITLGNDRFVGGSRGDLAFDMIRELRGFRVNAQPYDRYHLVVDGEPCTIVVSEKDQELVNESWRRTGQLIGDDGVIAFEEGSMFRIALDQPRGTGTTSTSTGAILSPMPGRIIAVDVAAGDTVTKGQKLVTLEAMKMEHSLTAPFDGTVAVLNAITGAQVQVDALLVRIEATPAA
jgi:3-methylcrotonyl-CoA carboxylase alpha subunit